MAKIDIKSIIKKYNLQKITIGVLGGHSALDVCSGAKKYGFNTVVVCQKGREKTYDKYFKARKNGGKGCVSDIILVDKFSDITKESVQKKLRSLNTIFIHNRYFWVYCNFEEIEKNFSVPIFGLREGVRLEERDQPNNQYELLKKAGIRIPKIYKTPSEIDRLVIVKVNEAARGYERAFFFANSEMSYYKEAGARIKSGHITREALNKAVIEEYIVGAHINLNFFYSPLSREVELMGTDTRRQTNLDGFLRLPAHEQAMIRKYMEPKIIETGHYSVTMKESLVEKAFDLGERFVKTLKKAVPPGIIGPFALQGAVAADDSKEDFVIFDVSMRIPGSPGTKFTPYSGYLYGDSLSYGERIAMEIKEAIDRDRLNELLT
jgi:5-formaminoimidazole-4-carboxamide-1-(beta)-D-ribofuranosyl 5'-monophosphate synthetase